MYEKRCRKIVEKNQHDSWTLAKYIFVDNRAVAWGRAEVMNTTRCRSFSPTSSTR
jgi:hypothetical protein